MCYISSCLNALVDFGKRHPSTKIIVPKLS